MSLIELKNVSFDYPIDSSLFEIFRRRPPIYIFKNLDLKINKGDVVGFYGNNGSGKSTLLKILAGVYQPVEGSIEINCNRSSFLNIFTGLNPELNGYDNIHQSLLMQQYKPEYINKQFINQIASYTELGEALFKPMRTYSSGMYIRIPFAVAVHKQSEVYLFDEWLSVGDDNFKSKANKTLDDLTNNSSAMVIASQSLDMLEKKCNRIFIFKDQNIEER